MVTSIPVEGRVSRPEHRLTPGEFAEFLCSDNLGADLGRVDYKFVRDMLVGIHRARSVNLTDVAKGLNENINLHATHKRLSRNLDNPALTENLLNRLLKLGARKVRADTRLIVHLYELNKRYARKVEYLPEPGLDSGGGFKVCEILASDPGSDSYTPLLATVWSDRVPGYVSDADEIRKATERVLNATGNKGMLYFDDLSMPGALLLPIMEEPKHGFIALMQGAEIDVVYRNEVCPLHALVDSIETPYGKTMFKLIPEGMLGKSKTDLDLFIHAGAMAIRLPNCDRPLSLIALKSKNCFLGEIVAPMITSKTYLRSRKALMGLVESFLSMQDVLTAHQTLRDSFDPASFRVLTYNRLQLLMTLLQSVIQYEASMKGNVSVEDQQISFTPHDGEMHRTYLLPGQQVPIEDEIDGQ
jgi:hypothetical protein